MGEDCNRCNEFHEHIYWEHKKTVRFCKTMVGDFSQRMCMPEKFMSQMKGSLSEIVDLRSPSGLVWNVGLTTSLNKVYLEYGWKEFVEAYHLEENDKLVFEYEGDSSFRVLMFDSSECERVSSYFSGNEWSKKRMKAGECSVEILEPSTEAVHEVHDCSSASNPNTGNILEEPMPSSTGHRKETGCSRRKIKKEIAGDCQLGDRSGNRNPAKSRAAEVEGSNAMKMAASFRAKGPSFITKMKGYNVDSQFQLVIPSDFAEKFLPLQNDKIFLRIPSMQKEWEVNYTSGAKAARIIGGWRNFVRENELKEGDVCVFVLSKSKKRVAMTVHIFRTVNKASSSSSA